jgi:uncharacterized membrane protein YkoI
MTDKMKNIVLVGTTAAGLTLGGSAIANAASDDSSGSSRSSTATTTNGSRPAGLPAQRSDETLLSGNAESQVRAAALAKVPGGTIERIETDADGHAKYEAHMTSASGERVTVSVNASFDVVSVDSGP